MPDFPRGLIEARLRFQYGEKVQSNVLHFLPPAGGFGVAELEAFVGLVNEWWSLPGGPFASPISFQNTGVTWVDTLAGFIPELGPKQLKYAVKVLKLAIGAAAGPGLPPDSAPVLRLHTLAPWRRPHGRLYFVGIAAQMCEEVQQDRLTSVFSQNLTDTFGHFQDYLDASYPVDSSPRWVVWNRSRQVGGDLAMPTVSPIVSVSMPSRVLGSQRLRLTNQRRVDRRGV